MEALDTRVRRHLLSEATALAAEARRKRPRFTTLRDRVAARDTGGTADGLRRLRAFWDNMAQIEASYLTLSKQQREIVTEFVRCACVKIIGEENFERNPPFFMREVGKTTQECLSIVITPRRFGKTTATSMYVAALLLTVPNIVVSIFSTGRRASSMLLAKIHQIVNGVPGERRVLACNQETLKLRGESVSDIRTCHSYPSNLNTLKGVGCDVGIMEEFTRCDPAVWQEVVVPLLGVNNTAIVAISTPLGEDNFYTGLINKRTENGDRLFNVIQFSLVCDACRAKGIATECQHKADILPPWKSQSRQRLVKFLLADSSDLFITEAMGEIATSKSRCFHAPAVDRWILAPRSGDIRMDSSACVYIAIDPTSGIRSELAIVSLYFDTDLRLTVSTPHCRAARISPRAVSGCRSNG